MKSFNGNVIDYLEVCDNSMMAIALFNAKTQELVYINRLARETLEMPIESQSLSLVLSELFPEKPHPKTRSFSFQFLNEAGFYQDILVRRQNNHHFLANIGVQYLQNKELLLLMFQDISFQKKLQREVQVKQSELMRSYQEILEQNKELQNLDEAKNKLIVLSTHELRTPLSAIIAMSEALNLDLLEDEKERKSYIRDIHTESKKLMSILNNMLDLLKLKTKKMPFFISQFSMDEILRQSISKLKEKAEQRNVEINYHCTSSAVAYVDRTRCSNALHFLLDNAINFSPEKAQIDVKIEETETYVLISISDHGKGVPLSQKERIFEEFTTLGEIDSHSQGTGLSLSIAKHSFEQMACELWLDESYEEGARFYIRCPKDKNLEESFYSETDPYDGIDF